MLDLAVPVWHPGLTKKQSADIESIRKVAFRIILQNDYVTYQLALTALGTQTLDDRQTRLYAKKFPLKMQGVKGQSLKLELIKLTLDKVETKSESLNLTLQGARRVAYRSWPNCSTQPSGRNNLCLKIQLYSCYLWMMGSWPGRWFFSIV